jgi:molecular chaperone GrpE (heat shock protein)
MTGADAPQNPSSNDGHDLPTPHGVDQSRTGAEMTESANEATEATETPAQGEATEQAETDQTDWKSEARKWEQRAKENRQAAAELEKQRKAQMNDAERAVADAEERGRTTATEAFGKRLATSEIRAAAADSGRDLTGVFEYLDLTRFLGDDGEPEAGAIKAFVDGLPVIDDGKPRAPRPDANQGRPGAGGPKSTSDSFAEFFRNNLSER